MKIIICLMFIGFGGAASADWRGLKAGDFTVAAKPEPGGTVDQQDLNMLLQIQATRTEAQCAEVGAMGKADFQELFHASALLSPTEFQRLAPLLEEAGALAAKIAKKFKKQDERPRPSDEDGRIVTCRKSGALDQLKKKSFSYPSTHATVGAASACLLSSVFPERAAALAAFGRRIGELRVIGGLHHPSDIVAGAKLGADFCQRLLNDHDFVLELNQANKP